MAREIPARYAALFAFYRFAYPILDSLRATVFPTMLAVVESTVLGNARVLGSDDAERFCSDLNHRTGANLLSTDVTPETTVGELCMVLMERAPAPTEEEISGFFQEFPTI